MKQRDLSRRELLKLSAGSLLALGLWPGCKAFGGGSPENYSIAVLNDLHCMSRECCEWLEKVAADVKSRAPRFCVIAGDLTDKAELVYMDAVDSIFKTVGCPVHVTIGNHDYVNDSDRSTFEKRFPGSLNYAFNEGGWQFIALDTTQGTKYDQTYIGTDTLQWLDSVLPRLSSSTPTVLFTHFPLAAKARHCPLNADAVLMKLLEFNLQAVFSGHYHGYTENRAGKTMLFTDRCCALKRPNHDGSKEKGYFVCNFKDGAVGHQFIPLSSV